MKTAPASKSAALDLARSRRSKLKRTRKLKRVVVPITSGRTKTLRLGCIDSAAVYAYQNGQCHALAKALHNRYGWRIFALVDGGVPDHFLASPDGAIFYDIEGVYLDEEEVVEHYADVWCTSVEDLSLEEYDCLDRMNQDTRDSGYVVPVMEVADAFARAVYEMFYDPALHEQQQA